MSEWQSTSSGGPARRLLIALADDAPAFRARIFEPEGSILRRLLIALADASPAFTPHGTERPPPQEIQVGVYPTY